VRDALDDAGLFCEVLDGDVSMQKRVREAQLLQYNKILVVGDAEVAAGTVNTRERDGTVTGEQRVADVALGCAEAIAAFE
jgi:threonyl-tRNA synthetase